MKKEGLVFILFLVLIFLAGCAQQQEIDFAEAQALIDWSESFPRYYTSENTNIEFQNYVDLALEKENLKECEQILSMESVDGETRDSAFHQCYELLIKKNAFSQKDVQECDELYEPEGGNLIYEECIAPITAYISIITKDRKVCERNLNNIELINKCKEDYEKLN